MEEKAEGGRSLIGSVLNLVDLVSVYVRQQLKLTVDQSIARPIGNAARKAAFFILAFTLFSLAVIFVAVGLFLALATLIGYILAYLVIGLALIIGGFLVFRQATDRETSD